MEHGAAFSLLDWLSMLSSELCSAQMWLLDSIDEQCISGLCSVPWRLYTEPRTVLHTMPQCSIPGAQHPSPPLHCRVSLDFDTSMHHYTLCNNAQKLDCTEVHNPINHCPQTMLQLNLTDSVVVNTLTEFLHVDCRSITSVAECACQTQFYASNHPKMLLYSPSLQYVELE